MKTLPTDLTPSLRIAPTAAAAPAETTAAAPVVSVTDLHKEFRRTDGTRVPAVDGVTFSVMAGEFVVLLGPSGCGKTTLLNSIAGLERPDQGEIEIAGEIMFSSATRRIVPAERRGISMVFQSYALWPHMTVKKNVSFPLECKPHGRFSERAARKKAVREVLDAVGISHLADQYPSQISGGQQQRVALARALVAGSNVVLFDEPLSNVDARVREQLRLELLSMQRDLGFAAVFVTHDQHEAMMLAHRILVMDSGRVAQEGTPEEIYESPSSRYVATFIGTSDEVPGIVLRARDDGLVDVDTPLGHLIACAASEVATTADAPVTLSWRPERCVVSTEEPIGRDNCWAAVVRSSIFLGSHTEHVLKSGELTFRTWTSDRRRHPEGAPVWLSVDPGSVRAFATETDREPRAE
jgi:iron(III) transport system ATP-binding protein